MLMRTRFQQGHPRLAFHFIDQSRLTLISLAGTARVVLLSTTIIPQLPFFGAHTLLPIKFFKDKPVYILFARMEYSREP